MLTKFQELGTHLQCSGKNARQPGREDAGQTKLGRWDSKIHKSKDVPWRNKMQKNGGPSPQRVLSRAVKTGLGAERSCIESKVGR